MPYVPYCWVDWDNPPVTTSLCGRYDIVDAKTRAQVTCKKCIEELEREDPMYRPAVFYQEIHDKLFDIANSLAGDKTGSIAAQLHTIASKVLKFK